MDIDIAKIEAMTRLAQQFGPFLFAILFILVVTRTAHGYYRECMTRTAPPPTDQEQKTYRLYFLCSVWVGIAAMALSIGWWLYAQAKGNNVYQIAIIDLNADERILSSYYFKDNPRPTIDQVTPMHDTYFLIVQDRPFQSGDRLAFQYFKIPTSPANSTGVGGRQLEVKYSSGFNLTYRVVADQSGPHLNEVAQNDRAPADVFIAEERRAADKRYANAAPPLSGSFWP